MVGRTRKSRLILSWTGRRAFADAFRPLDQRQNGAPPLTLEEEQLCAYWRPLMTANDEVIIETKDGEWLSLSRYRLAEESLFFQVLFCGTYKDSHSSRVRLACIPSFDFRSCLLLTAYLKNGIMPEVPVEIALNLMLAASFLQMDLLMEKLTDTIVAQVHTSNLLTTYRKATIRSAGLSKRLWDRLIKEFRFYLNSRDYETMTESEILTALLDERLDIQCREEEPLIDNWIQKNPGNHDRIIRLKSEALRLGGTDGQIYPVIRDRVSREVLIAIGGWCSGGPSDIVEVFNPRAQTWRVPEVIMREYARAYHGAALCGEKLVIVGGISQGEHSYQAKWLDLNIKSWYDISNMQDRRCYVAATAYQSSAGTYHLVAMGGNNGHWRLNTAEILHVEMNHWCRLPPMFKHRSDAGAAVLAGRPTVVGGFDGRIIHNDIEMLDFGSQLWLRGSHSMRSVRTGVSAVTYEGNSLIVIGGFDGVWRLRSMEFYDYRIGYWYPLPEMTTTRSNFGIEVMNGSIYIAGGYDGIQTTDAVERFDMRACRWERLTPLGTPRSALQLIRIADHDIIQSLVNYHPSSIDFEMEVL